MAIFTCIRKSIGDAMHGKQDAIGCFTLMSVSNWCVSCDITIVVYYYVCTPMLKMHCPEAQCCCDCLEQGMHASSTRLLELPAWHWWAPVIGSSELLWTLVLLRCHLLSAEFKSPWHASTSSCIPGIHISRMHVFHAHTSRVSTALFFYKRWVEPKDARRSLCSQGES